MTTYDVLVYGSWTKDLILYNDKKINDYGGMANVIRNLRPALKLKYIETELNYVTINFDNKTSKIVNTVRYKNGLTKNHRYNWTHIGYLDWLRPSLEVMEFIRNVSTYVSVDVAGFGKSLDQLEKYVPYVDVMFCSHLQENKLLNFPTRFMHGDMWWSFDTYRHLFDKIPDLTFDIGAGDALVASILNTCRTPMEITHKFGRINKNLNIRLQDREKWWLKRIS